MTDFLVARCENCGNVVLDDRANNELIDAVRVVAGLLRPSVIRERREALGFTQKTLAGPLRVAESALSRWESGGQIQQRAMDMLLRTAFISTNFVSLPPKVLFYHDRRNWEHGRHRSNPSRHPPVNSVRTSA